MIMGVVSKVQLIAAVIFVLFFLTLLVGYGLLVVQSNRRYRKWPRYRTFCWIGGLLSAAFVVVSLLCKQPNFVEHMLHHLFLGMLSPLLFVFSSPITLLLRALPVIHARRVTKMLKSRWSMFYHHPVVASLLNIGGLWLLYRTDLHHIMHHNWVVSFMVHVHLFVAGYLFTASMKKLEPWPHRYAFRFRAIVLIVALAGHALLAKLIYADPPLGVSTLEAKIGGMLMYYGGDLIEVIIIVFLCLEQYRATRSRHALDARSL